MPLYLLGPQRPAPNLPTVLDAVGGSGPIVYVTAGWRHDEDDDEALQRDVGVDGHSLPLYRWFEELAKTAPDLFRTHHVQQEEIRKLKALYRLRLDPALEAVRILIEQQRLQPESDFIRWELQDAISVLKGIRERFVAQCDAVRARYDDTLEPLAHPAVKPRHDEIVSVLAEARAILVAGGHVGVLRNRLAYFGLGPALRDTIDRGAAVIAWSAGAMSLTDKVVLFHDDPPVGQPNAEILDRGLGLAEGIVALPHARERLWLDDDTRVAVLAARFDPVPCVALENGAWLERVDGRWINRGPADAALRLGTDGLVYPVEGPDGDGTADA